MNNVLYQTKVLNREVRHSNEYNQYLRTRDKLKENQELYQKAMEFRKRSMLLQNEADYNTLDEIGALRREYAQVLAIPLVNDFLVAEQRVITMLRRMEELIYGNLDLEIDLLE